MESKNKIGVAKKIVIGIVVFAVVILSIVAIWLDQRGLMINNVHVPLHSLGHYQDIVVSGMQFDVIKGLDVPENMFRAVLTDRHDITVDDIVSGQLTVPWQYTCDVGLQSYLNKYNETATPSENAYVDVDTVEIVPETYGTKIDVDKLMSALDGRSFLDISDYYVKPDILAEDLVSSIDLFKEYQNWHVDYLDSDISIKIPQDALTIDRKGHVTVSDYTFVDDYLSDVEDMFTTSGKGCRFVTHDGDVVSVNGGTFGNVVDVDAERAEVLKLLNTKQSASDREPVYQTDMGAIGGDYVEVSIPEQHVWLYRDGEVVLDSDCVTGCVSKHRNTPTGLFYIDMRMPGKMLYPKGETKGSWVNRWMRFTPDGCGLHDATWRGSFGGNIYQTNGSHGCVNLPKQFAYDLYELVYEGLPVIVYD